MLSKHLDWNQASPEIEESIENCRACHSICLHTATYCLQQGWAKTEVVLLNLLLDCAEICQTSTQMLLRSSHFQTQVCGICAVICDRCAQDCEKMNQDPQMKVCAEICRRCAASCRQIAIEMA